MISEPSGYISETLVEQLKWVENELDKWIQASGVEDGWFVPYASGNIPWDGDPEHRADILGSIMPLKCGYGGKVSEGLVVRDVPDPVGAALKVRAAWEAEGWVVSDLYGPPIEDNAIFKADREDGAMLGFDANSEGLILKVYGACSSDPTMDWSNGDLSERDAFIEEVLSREPE